MGVQGMIQSRGTVEMTSSVVEMTTTRFTVEIQQVCLTARIAFSVTRVTIKSVVAAEMIGFLVEKAQTQFTAVKVTTYLLAMLAMT